MSIKQWQRTVIRHRWTAQRAAAETGRALNRTSRPPALGTAERAHKVPRTAVIYRSALLQYASAARTRRR